VGAAQTIPEYHYKMVTIYVVVLMLSAAGALGAYSALATNSSWTSCYVDSCNLCEREFTIILATGRSGSTTLLEMINQLPGYDLGGEQAGQFNSLYDFYKHYKESQNRGKQSHGQGAWANRVENENPFLCWIQAWYFAHSGSLKVAKPTTRVHGFKEIRYNKHDVIDFLIKVFPCGKFITNYRLDIAKQHKSKFHKHTSVNELEKMTDTLVSSSQKYPKRMFEMPLERFDNITLWDSLFSWLGMPNCRATSVAWANNHSYVAAAGKFVKCS
jgi:hypothetical protein